MSARTATGSGHARYVRDFADLFDDLGAAAFRARFRAPALVGVGLFGAIEDVEGRRTHGVDQESAIVAIQSLLDRVYFIDKRSDDNSRWVTIGQDHDNDIVIAEYTLSSRHCAFTIEARKTLVADLGSLNGTLMDGRPLPARRPVPLVTGKKLTLGRLQLIYLSPQGFFRHVRDRSSTGAQLCSRGASEPPAPAIQAVPDQHELPNNRRRYRTGRVR